MNNKNKEIRDPIHDFVEITAQEQLIVNSPAFQRLRDISQLSFTHLVYPGATHKRFEHSLGVMKVASDIFDAMIEAAQDDKKISKRFSKELSKPKIAYWRQVVRIAALCHDIGHLPFSHTLEELLKSESLNKYGKEISHEELSQEIIENDLRKIIVSIQVDEMNIKVDDVSFISRTKDTGENSRGTQNIKDLVWKRFLRSMISSDFFGADRIDYLLRDAYHAGVPYGIVDIQQLIRSIKPAMVTYIESGTTVEKLKLNAKGGDKLAIIATILMAREVMYSQVYQHPICKVYDIHLEDFVEKYVISEKILGIDSIEDLVKYTDSDLLHILGEVQKKSEPDNKVAIHAERLLERKHYKLVMSIRKNEAITLHKKILEERKGEKIDIIDESHLNDAKAYVETIRSNLQEEFGEDNIRISCKITKGADPTQERFLVEGKDNTELADQHGSRYREIFKALTTSEKGDFVFFYVYAHPLKYAQVTEHLKNILES